MFDEVIDMANKNLQINEYDYFENGILFCGKCRTPKQAKLTCYGDTQLVRCMCKCESDEYDRREAEYKERDRLEALERRRGMSFDENRMTKWTFEEDDNQNAKVSGICKKYVERFDEFKERGKGLLLYGTVGTGKTFYAACITNALISKGKACLMTNFSRLEMQIRCSNDQNEFLNRLNDYDLLVIDDLTAERPTPYMQEIVQSVIDARYRAGLPLIVTTNLSGAELQSAREITYARIFSRLYDLCVPVEVKGVDRRKQGLKTERDELREMLGITD